jgi:hypothetical protein
MTIDETITELREQSRSLFYFGDYSQSAHIAQIADWLVELQQSRELVKFLASRMSVNDAK